MSSQDRDSEKGGLEVQDVRDMQDGAVKDATTLSHPDDFGFTKDEAKSLIRCVDRRLVVTVGALYCVSLMDRANLPYANIAGMGVELGFAGTNRYSIITCVFFITYIIFQAPSTVVIRKLGPRIHLSVITVLWGAVMIGMGFVETWGQLAGLRVVLGALEAGFFPSCVYLLSTWYTRYEVGQRYAWFFLVGCVASAFSGILAYGLMQMHGEADLAGWQWIFVIEGIITCALGIGSYWLLVDFPDSSRKTWSFLTKRERDWIVARVNHDRGDTQVNPFNMREFLRGGLDPKIYGYAIIFLGTTTMAYALAYFMPIILLYSLEFSLAESQCLVAPPYVFAGIVMYVTSWAGDKYKLRGPIIIFNMVLAVIGLAIMGWHSDAWVRYFGVFLCTAGANSNVPATMAYQANNIRGQWKRAFCSATLVGFGGIGGIIGSTVFRDQDAPQYEPGLYVCAGFAVVNILIVGVLSLAFKAQNAKADAGEAILEDDDSEMEHNSDFRYTY